MADSLRKAKLLASEARDLELQIGDLETSLAQKKARLNFIKSTELPDLLQEVGMNSIGLDPMGNAPAYEVRIKPYYAAAIPAKWGEQQKKKAFKALADHGASALIKTEVTFSFGRGEYEKAQEFAQANAHLHPSVKESVHHASLTAWVREQVEAGHSLPDLETIGARIGSVAELERR